MLGNTYIACWVDNFFHFFKLFLDVLMIPMRKVLAIERVEFLEMIKLILISMLFLHGVDNHIVPIQVLVVIVLRKPMGGI